MTPVKLDAISQIARSVADIEEATRWYREVLGLHHLYTFGKLAFFDCGGTRLLLSQETAPSTVESILYFRVADIHQAHEYLTTQGVKFVNGPHMIHKHADGTEEWMAFFTDPEGRPLAIMCRDKTGPLQILFSTSSKH